MQTAAANWVMSNCTDPKLVEDLLRFLSDEKTNMAGVNSSFLVGGGMTRSGAASLAYLFAGELFVFQLTDAQAAFRGVNRCGMYTTRNRVALSDMRAPDKVVISLDRLELLRPTMEPTTPLVGRVHYQLQAKGEGPLSVRLDFEMGERWRSASNRLHQPPWGKGALDISFPPVATDAGEATGFKGPLVLFVRLCTLPPVGRVEPEWRAISNTVATLCEVV